MLRASCHLELSKVHGIYTNLGKLEAITWFAKLYTHVCLCYSITCHNFSVKPTCSWICTITHMVYDQRKCGFNNRALSPPNRSQRIFTWLMLVDINGMFNYSETVERGKVKVAICLKRCWQDLPLPYKPLVTSNLRPH